MQDKRREHLEQLLHELGATPVPDTDELTVARIEARWRSAAEGVSPQRQPARRHRSNRPAIRRRPAVVSAAALVAAAAGIALVLGIRSPSGPEVVVAEAQGITVVLPSGEVITPLAGEELPEGAIVQSAPGSAGKVGNDRLSPGIRYIVEKGRLRPASAAPSSTTVAPIASSSTAPSTTNRVSPNSAITSTTVDSGTTAAPTSTVAHAPAPARLTVAVTRTPKRTRITWTPFGGSRVKRYVVVRVKSWNGATLPKGKRIATVGRNKAMVATDRSPVDGTYYVVAALGERNTVLAIGSVAVPAAPAHGTTSTTHPQRKRPSSEITAAAAQA